MRETFMIKVTERKTVKDKEVDTTIYIMCHNIVAITPSQVGCRIQTVSHAYDVIETAEQILNQTKGIGTMIVVGAGR